MRPGNCRRAPTVISHLNSPRRTYRVKVRLSSLNLKEPHVRNQFFHHIGQIQVQHITVPNIRIPQPRWAKKEGVRVRGEVTNGVALGHSLRAEAQRSAFCAEKEMA